ncbi:unnamed protein product [Callosobruchus maculatus]|uniref:Uncharacterized protein n=1 Tax=Callosobruchus maculatus TaxID=64391 RepID=A0A653D080_CALMS|nr:unnamed protein product [Callosobruchus maculatus]
MSTCQNETPRIFTYFNWSIPDAYAGPHVPDPPKIHTRCHII